MFWTETEPGTSRHIEPGERDVWLWQPEIHSSLPGDVDIADLSEETWAEMVDDCLKFQSSLAWVKAEIDQPVGNLSAQGGHDFWLTRNSHGAGFWDGDWPEPYATQLTEAAKEFGEFNLYLGDDGRIYS